MNFYEKINRKDVTIPYRFKMRVGQMIDLKDNAPGMCEIIATAFRFGYMQGIRAERAGKAVM